jgi:hypothetical protein
MNRFTPAVPVALVLVTGSGVALAADQAPRVTAAPVAATAAAAPATGTSPASQTSKVTKASANTSSNSSMHRLVCLNMSLQCFAVKPKPEDSTAKTRTASLDLKAPDVRRVAPATLYASVDEPVDIEEQQVQVEGTRPEVYVPGGLASLPWAVMHPTQAWRIFMPVPPSQTK